MRLRHDSNNRSLLEQGSNFVPPPPPPVHEIPRPQRRLRLGKAEDVIEFKRRPFVCAYYRLDPPCWNDLWCCHNELGNIWTHVIAAILTFAQFCFWLRESHQGMQWSYPQVAYRMGVLVYFVAGVTTFCISSQYHWRLSSAEKEVLRWCCLDQSACLILVVLGFFAGVPMGFHCFPFWQVTYALSSVSICIVMALSITMIPKDRWELIAGIIITGTAVGYVTPAVHWLILSEPGRNVSGAIFVAQIIITGIAIIFYTKYIPERFSPGVFDLVGQSHQLWHVAIYISVACYGEVLVRVIDLIDRGIFCA